ncbi:MAG: diguanylate cyclase [Magnetococcales bacterium]|nr:diguanylate cyclase [Magnetococcales bacterium]
MLLIHQAEQTSTRIATHLKRMVPEMKDPSQPMVISEELREEILKISKDIGLVKCRLYDAQGKILFSTVTQEVGRISDESFFFSTVAKGQSYSEAVTGYETSREGEHFDTDVVETYVPIMIEGRFNGAFEIYWNITREMEKMNRLVVKGSVIVVVLSLALTLLILYVRHSVVYPVSRISIAMERMALGDLDHRVPEMGGDELGDMARVFNQMCQQLKNAHMSLEQERDKLNTILLGAQEGIVSTDASGAVALVNPSAEALLGKSRQQIVDGGFLNLLDDPEFLSSSTRLAGIDTPSTVVYNEKILNIQVASIHNIQGGLIGTMALLRDVTAEKELEDKLRNLSYTDPLTNLFNRRRMDELLQNEYNRATRYKNSFGFMLIDVDHFKRFNDEYGHDQGDRVLVSLAKTMRDHFRSVDYCCRYGGEEFAVILPNTQAQQVFEAAERLRQKVARMNVDGLQVTISIGISNFIHGRSLEQLVKSADNALYQVKQHGRNGVVLGDV